MSKIEECSVMKRMILIASKLVLRTVQRDILLFSCLERERAGRRESLGARLRYYWTPVIKYCNTLCPRFKNESSSKTSDMKVHGKELDLHDNEPVEKTQFHMNDLSRRLRFDIEAKDNSKLTY